MLRNLSTRLISFVAVFLTGAVSASAAVPLYRTDLTDGADALITKKFLHSQYHVMQSFAFNNDNGEIYAVQVEATDSAGTWSQHWANGDLELTRLSADGNTILGYMYLRGFGHGVSIGVEPVARRFICGRKWTRSRTPRVRVAGQSLDVSCTRTALRLTRRHRRSQNSHPSAVSLRSLRAST